MREVLEEIVRKGVGMTTITSADGRLTGVITDGDLKRILLANDDVLSLTARDVMTRTPRTITPEATTLSAVERMENNPSGRITSLVVIDTDARPIGVVHLHDCLRP